MYIAPPSPPPWVGFELLSFEKILNGITTIIFNGSIPSSYQKKSFISSHAFFNLHLIVLSCLFIKLLVCYSFLFFPFTGKCTKLHFFLIACFPPWKSYIQFGAYPSLHDTAMTSSLSWSSKPENGATGMMLLIMVLWMQVRKKEKRENGKRCQIRRYRLFIIHHDGEKMKHEGISHFPQEHPCKYNRQWDLGFVLGVGER